MIDNYDVIVVGLGSIGSAAAHTLAARGLRVLGLETFGPAHDQGSAHGGTRIVRQAYFEGPGYVPLLRAAFDGWWELQEQSGRDLIRLCGGIYISDPDGVIFKSSLEAALAHGLPHEVLGAAEMRARFPTMHPADHAVGLYEPNAGYVRPEETVLAGVDLARQHGARLHFEEPVTNWTITPGVESWWSPRKDATGPIIWYWLLAHGLRNCSRCPSRSRSSARSSTGSSPTSLRVFPISVTQRDTRSTSRKLTGMGIIYGFPMVDGPDGGLKLAFYRQNTGTTTPQTIDRTVHPEEVEAMRRRARQLFPHLTGRLVKAATCMYASAPDDHFVIGRLADTPQVVAACGFSGHGFKFVPVVGQIVADLVDTGSTAYDISMFDPYRPAFLGAP
jgi:sarcosine oxidase